MGPLSRRLLLRKRQRASHPIRNASYCYRLVRFCHWWLTACRTTSMPNSSHLPDDPILRGALLSLQCQIHLHAARPSKYRALSSMGFHSAPITETIALMPRTIRLCVLPTELPGMCFMLAPTAIAQWPSLLAARLCPPWSIFQLTQKQVRAG